MKHRLKFFPYLFVLCVVWLTACGAEPVAPPSSSGAPAEELREETPPEAEPEEVTVNPFTGEEGYAEELLTRRPVAVMFNNVKPAWPQKGISQADIVYEMQVEGGITRLMGIYSDYQSLPELGSIRSARPDFIELLLPFQAVYVHFGQSEQAKSMLSQYAVSDINGTELVTKAFYFDEERASTRSSEHCWFTNAALIQAGIQAKSIEMEGETLSPIFSFVRPGEEAMPDTAQTATAIQVPMSGYVTAAFTYDETTGTYGKEQFGEAHLDANTGEAARVTNVFVMYTSCETMADGVHKDIGLESGSGYYLSHGKLQEVVFQKNGPEEPMQVLDAQGNPVAVNPGKSWFSIAPLESRNSTQITGASAAE